MLERGESFAGCRIIQSCGRGAFGTVYLAENAVGRTVALKLFDSPEAGERELRGIRNYMRLPQNAPSLIAIHHTGIEDGRFYYIMDAADNAAEDPAREYLPDTLALRMQRSGRMSLQEAAELCCALTRGLEAMHAAGLLHRDIKPSNILFVNGEPLLGDPGVVGDLSHTLSVAGTLGFLPPELFSAAAKPSPGSDIYALGKVFYCAVTGNAPGEYPTMPRELDSDTLIRICRPLARLCNAVPEKRCASCAECRTLLRQSLRRQGPIAACFRRFSADPAWRRRVLTVASVGLSALLITVAAAAMLITGHQRRIREEQAIRTQRRDALRREMVTLEERMPRLLIQLETLPDAPNPAEEVAAVAAGLEADDLDAAEAALNKLRSQLEKCAAENLPAPLPDAVNAADIVSRFRRNAGIFGYLDSPLGKWYMPPERNDALRREQRAAAAEISAAGGFANVICGQDFVFNRSARLEMKFLPPGRFHSPVTRKTETIDYPFWMLESELTYRQALFYSKALGKRDGHLDSPVTFITWNDLLVICDDLTNSIRLEIDLPPGYAVRPPTEAEWEYAAQGGMTGKIPAPVENTLHEAASAQVKSPANEYGIRNLDRNLTEVVIPYPEHRKQEGWVAVRGADFRQAQTGIDNRLDMRMDQSILNYIGYRLVIAPVEKEFREKAWFTPPPLSVASIRGVTYAGFDCCFAQTDWREARQIAEILGGHLPEPENGAHLNEIFNALKLDNRYPTPLGIRWQDGAWRKLSDNQPAPLAGEVPPAVEDSKRLFLSMSPGKEKPVSFPVHDRASLPAIIIQFPGEITPEKRSKASCELTFEVDGRKFGILKAHMSCYVQPPFVKFAGYRQPVFHDRATLDKIVSRLKNLQGSVAVGAYSYYGKWRWTDDSEAKLNYDLQPLGAAVSKSYPLSYEAIIAHSGKLAIDIVSDYILVEL